MEDGESSSDGEGFALLERPRLRQITGVRIHQLTLPESIPLASKLLPDPSEDGDFLGESSSITSSPHIDNSSSFSKRASSNARSRKERRISTSTIPESLQTHRQRSASTTSSTLAPPSPIHIRTRTTRPHAPTLAGEAIECGGASSSRRVMIEEDVVEEVHTRRLARCFVVLKLPDNTDQASVPVPKTTNGEDTTLVTRRSIRASSDLRPTLSRISSTSTPSPPSTPVRSRPPLPNSTPPGHITQRTDSTPRHRTTSLTSSSPSRLSVTTRPGPAHTNRESTTSSTRVQSGKSLSLVSSGLGNRGTAYGSRPSHTSRSSNSHTSPTQPFKPSNRPSPSSPRLSRHTYPSLSIPFYISPIHHWSTHPRFLSLSHETDFAPWLTTEQSASETIHVEIWYEDGLDQWHIVDAISGPVQLSQLRRLERDQSLSENTLQFTLSSDPKSVYYLPKKGFRVVQNGDAPIGKEKRDGKQTREAVRGMVERSMRETRMKKGVGVGGLHQLVNIQTVLVDTKRDVDQVCGKIDRLLANDADWRAMRRSVSHKEEQCRWIQNKIDEVDKTTREVRAHLTLREQALEERLSTLSRGHESVDLLRGRAMELRNGIVSVDTERNGLLTTIYHYRTYHVQTLDSLFPILPLHPPTLLYSILDVPLPIPSGAKDPAPPLSLPPAAIPEGVQRVDERTTAAALGYVAMVVQILGGLGGAVGGVPYPVACAGSRSLVKDVVSVMQGPRSFPLYAKGVERYRYEYAVFLLNKNIEMLMQEANIRLLDLRHTLPNLKILLLTLSSPIPPAPISTLSRISTFVDSRSSSRQTSRNWPSPYRDSPGSSAGRQSPVGSRVGGGGGGVGGVARTPSPLTKAGRSGLRTSLGVVKRDIAQEIELGSERRDRSDDEMTEGAEEGNHQDEDEKRSEVSRRMRSSIGTT